MLLTLTPSCAGNSGPTAADPHVPCSSLSATSLSDKAIDAMTFQEAQRTLANARVIKRVCGK